MSPAKVAYIKGDDLYASVRKSLEAIEEAIEVKPRVVIKPNFVSTRKQLSATKVAHVEAIVDFFGARCKEIVVAESPAMGRAEDGYANYGYYDRLKGVRFANLDEGEREAVEIVDSRGGKTQVRVSKLLMDEDTFVISAGKLKTHDIVVATLSAKNVIMASMLEKSRMHPDYKSANRNMAEVMKHLHIDLAVMDGINAMEGNGPCSGTWIDAGCVIASTDFLAADRVALEVMGIDPDRVGYLNYIYELGFGEYDMEEIEIVGDGLERKRFRLHDEVEAQYRWR